MKRSEITEETRYVWVCPKCKEYNEDCEDHDHDEFLYCENCSEEFELEDDE